MKDEVTLEELQTILKNKQPVVVLDVRSKEEYDEQHIPIAQNIPLDQLAASLSLFESSKIYVITCGSGGGRSMQGATIMRDAGLDAKWLVGGTFGWFK